VAQADPEPQHVRQRRRPHLVTHRVQVTKFLRRPSDHLAGKSALTS
jgi:hypothetical protein